MFPIKGFLLDFGTKIKQSFDIRMKSHVYGKSSGKSEKISEKPCILRSLTNKWSACRLCSHIQDYGLSHFICGILSPSQAFMNS